MEAININSVTQYITDDGKDFYERVLWIDVSTDSVVVIDLGKKETFPVMKKLSDLKYLVESKQCRIVSYQLKGLPLFISDDFFATPLPPLSKLAINKAFLTFPYRQ